MKTETRHPRQKRVAMLALAGAAASLMILPMGQGVAGASAGASDLQAGVGHIARGKPPARCGWRRCGWWEPRWRGGQRKNRGDLFARPYFKRDKARRLQEERFRRTKPVEPVKKLPIKEEKDEMLERDLRDFRDFNDVKRESDWDWMVGSSDKNDWWWPL
ncbi:hypothetical protein ABZ897_02520 [Nonomuraea sp. NPDC046802]|uniref:hypothetical protein n=1 Tax=Nonomuraea sp. NPDC046802 TaxID=3154919 RepID=UPI0033D28765